MRDALAGWMIGDTSKDVGEPGPRIDPGELARLDQRVDGCGPRPAGIGATEMSNCASPRAMPIELCLRRESTLPALKQSIS